MAQRIEKCLIGRKCKEEINELNALEIKTIHLPESPFLDNEINGHADILSFNTGDGKIFIDSSIKVETEPFLKGYEVISCELIKSPYPNDVKLNGALLGDKLVCNNKMISTEILAWATHNNIHIINVKQGYTKCNICILNNDAVITEDDGIARLLKNYQIDVLKLKSGYVELSEKHYGFIGGASAKISDNEIYFSGDITSHPEFYEINKFLNKYGFSMIYNQNRALRDFGGLIALQ